MFDMLMPVGSGRKRHGSAVCVGPHADVVYLCARQKALLSLSKNAEVVHFQQNPAMRMDPDQTVFSRLAASLPAQHPGDYGA